ncbi:uncharacterized protein LOC111611720 [Xiphophorus maculatus]|uniref:uncharacterized protein LOC111611720 n=1 Tax=Xiphophorus maculatus TaxID=8083 RepID=UPI000C6D849C|nr:uncharacterized protein LOC111611720 [Xiphophorus maculatus]
MSDPSTMRNPTTDLLQELLTSLEELKKYVILASILKRIHIVESTTGSDEWKRLMKLAEENCTNQTVLKWLKEKPSTFYQLVDMFNFFKKHIDEEQKKNHSDTVDITFVAHGAIGDFMIPASCLLPLASIRDLVLYSPWNCVSGGVVLTYAMATGKLKPQHRLFYTKKVGCMFPDKMHQSVKLPDRWNSMRQAGDQMIPNITVSPLRPDDGVWKSFESLTKKYGPIGRNRIVIPFILPGEESESVPFSVVTLALSLVLRQSRFKATVHLDTCLADKSIGQKLDREYLEKQYACAPDETVMICSNDILSFSVIDYFKSFFS